jgi:hypothetical protein
MLELFLPLPSSSFTYDSSLSSFYFFCYTSYRLVVKCWRVRHSFFGHLGTKERKVSKTVTQDSSLVPPPQTQGKAKEIIQVNPTTVMDFSMTDIDQPDYEENVEITEMPQTRKLRKIAPAQVLNKIEKSTDISTYRHFENVVAEDGTFVTIERHSNTRYFTKMGDNGQYITYDEEGKVVNLEAIYPTMTEDIGSSL